MKFKPIAKIGSHINFALIITLITVVVMLSRCATVPEAKYTKSADLTPQGMALAACETEVMKYKETRRYGCGNAFSTENVCDTYRDNCMAGKGFNRQPAADSKAH